MKHTSKQMAMYNNNKKYDEMEKLPMYSCQVMNGNAMSMPISRIGHLAGRNIHIKAKVAAAVAIPVQFCNCQLWID